MFKSGEVRKYVEFAEEALKLRTINPLHAIKGLVRVHELMMDYMRESWEFERPSDCDETKENYLKLQEAFHSFSISEAKIQNTWFNPAENYDGRGVKVADIRHYLDDWHVFFMQKTYAEAAGKPELNTLDDALSYEQRFKVVDGEGENEVERDYEEISTADLLAFYLDIAIAHERDELIEEAYVRGFIDKKRKEEMLNDTTLIDDCRNNDKTNEKDVTKFHADKTQPEYTVTGIRYQMGDNLTYEEMTDKAERFVAGLRKGQKVLLMAEPNNPVDPNAIAVYVDFDHIGYISKEEAGEVHNLLNDKQQCNGLVERTDGHVTFFITIPGAHVKTIPSASHARKISQSPLGENVKMPFTKEENKLGLLASQLEEIEVSKDNIRKVIGMAEKYIPLLKLSVCHEETLWMNKIAKKLENMYKRRKQLDINDADAKMLNKLFKAVREAVSDMHCTTDHWPERVFVEHLDRLRNNKSVNLHLYKKYCDTFLDGKDFTDADKALVSSEHERLCGWLRGMKWSELRNPQDLNSMGTKVNYLGLSRKELYDLFSVLLLIEKLEMAMNADIVPHSIEDEDEGLNYFQPTRHLQDLLKQPWFAEVRTDGYDAAWTDAFVEALIGSEYGEQIARDWSAKRSRHTLIKGCVIGLLKDNGVLKGSNRAIARMIVSENPNYGRNKTNDAKEANNLSRKMSDGWNQPYALWVKKYVEGNNKPKE